MSLIELETMIYISNQQQTYQRFIQHNIFGNLMKPLTGWWFQTIFMFHHIWVVILPIDELIFFNMVKTIIELDEGKIYRKALYLMAKTMVSCRFSLKPIH
jgi:hypothetical protein